MDFIDKLAKGFAAAKAVMGSDAVGETRELTLDGPSASVKVGLRRKRDGGSTFVRVELPSGNGFFSLDLTPRDADVLAEELRRLAEAAGGPGALIDVTPRS
jgi:hypothetical protein